MRFLALVVLMSCGRPVPSPPPPVARVPVPLPPADARSASADAAPPDPLAALPAAAPPLAAGDAAAVDAYYRHAAAIATSASDQALAQLLQIARRPRCAPCAAALVIARRDDAWRALWDHDAFEALLEARQAQDQREFQEDARSQPPDEEPSYGRADPPKLDCPKGTSQRGKWKEGSGEQWCARPNGKRHGAYYFREEGYSLSEGTHTISGTYRDGVMHGHWSEFASYDPSPEGEYVDGKREGAATIGHRHDDEYVFYVADELEGTATRWSNENRILDERHYVHDKLDGVYREWSADPHQLLRTGEYAHGVPWGTFDWYDEHGKVETRLVLDHGNGAWTEHNGPETWKGSLKDGLRDGAWTVEREGVIGRGAFLADKQSGVWTWTDAGGHKLREGAFQTGLRTGAWTYWHEDGSPLATGAFAKGKLDGTWSLHGDTDEEHQKVVFRAGKLVMVGRTPATARFKNGLAAQPDFEDHPAIIVEADATTGASPAP